MAGKDKGKPTAKAAAPRKQAPSAAPKVEAPAAAAPVVEAAPVVGASVAYGAPESVIEADDVEVAPAADTPESPSVEAIAVQVTHLQVSARKEGFRRAGRAWTVAETLVAIDEFTTDQVEQLLAEPKLVVLPISGIAG